MLHNVNLFDQMKISFCFEIGMMVYMLSGLMCVCSACPMISLFVLM